ncbi:MAG: protein arginine kinase [Selenomonadaceae bacterium]|nr:protein arginine kinase [Selenomonadaceae bacterium]MBR4696034.1 protein arginine kinase [Selenomonadaceae bacterium]
MALADLFGSTSLPWLNIGGRESDVVLSSRIRLARNFRGIPFPNRADFTQLAKVQEMASSVLPEMEHAVGQSFDAVDMDRTTPLEREVLIEKRLITRNFLRSPQHRVVFISQGRHVSVMVNEEDHLRIQCMVNGLDLDNPLSMASGIDDLVESQLDVAFDERMGYLTSCPTNLGTGLRASVLLHLPGLVYTRNINNIINISQQLGLSVRALYGEDDQEWQGNIFQISNQLTLGFSEEEIVGNLKSAAKEIVSHERRARKALELYRKDQLEDSVWRAYGILCHARSLSEKEVLDLLSKVRLGVDMGFIGEACAACFSEILIGSRTSYLQNLAGSDNMSGSEIDRMRAEAVRKILSVHRVE